MLIVLTALAVVVGLPPIGVAPARAAVAGAIADPSVTRAEACPI